MKRILFLVFLCCSATLVSCHGEDEDIISQFDNHPLPVGEKHLKVLSIGNSYLSYGTDFLPQITYDLQLDQTTFSVYLALKIGASLMDWWHCVVEEEQLQLMHRAGAKMPVVEGTLKELIAQDWDVITLQQYSGDADSYRTFLPYLRYLLNMIRERCKNPNVAVVWNMAWSYAELYGDNEPTLQRWERISQTTQQMMRLDGIDILVPTGTAIQNARQTWLNTPSDLTIDGTHPDLGVGRYIASCTYFQALFAPVYGVSIVDDKQFTYIVPEEEQARYPFASVSVTDENRALCHQCVLNAILQPFKVAM